jgi:hypothetical protein
MAVVEMPTQDVKLFNRWSFDGVQVSSTQIPIFVDVFFLFFELVLVASPNVCQAAS